MAHAELGLRQLHFLIAIVGDQVIGDVRDLHLSRARCVVGGRVVLVGVLAKL
jgi:hypothetical protein